MKRKWKVVILSIVLTVIVIVAGSVVYISNNKNVKNKHEKETIVSEAEKEKKEEEKEVKSNEEIFRLIVEDYYSNTNRRIDFKKIDKETEKQYVPKITLDNNTDEERIQFCREVRECMEKCLVPLPYKENKKLYSSIIVSYVGNEQEFALGELLNKESYDGTTLYNELYLFLEQWTLEIYEKQCTESFEKEKAVENEEQKAEEGQEGKEEQKEKEVEVSEEILQIYLSQEPECTYTMSDGTEYGLVLADRACGSSYYVLISDEDGGKSFISVEYPSAKIQLPDGTYYNPFIMPEKVYEENEKLYMEAGQGPEGDYYGKEGYCAGLYESIDLGKTWSYVKEIPVR